MNWKAEKETLVPLSSPALALSVDQDRVAVLRADRRIDVRASDGSATTTLETASPQAIALRGNALAVLTRAGTLEIWNLATKARERSWPLPRDTAPAVDVHFGIAVFSTTRAVYAMRLDTGHVVRLARLSGAARVQIEALGIAYQYNNGGQGFVRFIRLSLVEHALGTN